MKLSFVAAGAIAIPTILACADSATFSDAGTADAATSDASAFPDDAGGDVVGFGDANPNCTVAPDAVYTLDVSEHIYRFDPPTKQFCDLGLLDFLAAERHRDAALPRRRAC